MRKIYSLLLTMFAVVVSSVAQTTAQTSDITVENGDNSISWKVGEVSFKALKNNGQTAPSKNGSANDIRTYAKNTIEVTAPEGKTLTGLVFNISTAGLKRLAPITATAGTIATQAAGDKSVTWSGNAGSVTLTVGDKADYGTDGNTKAGQLDFDAITVTLDGEAGGEDPGTNPEPQPEPETPVYTLPYANTLMTTDKTSDFTITDKTLGEGLNFVWSFTSTYGAKATAFANKVGYEAESWLESPVFDLTAVTNATVSFEHAANYFADVETAKSQTGLYVKEEGAEEYTKVEVPNYPQTLDWDFVSSGDIDLSAYAGKKIQLMFKYVSNGESVGTWEVKNFSFKDATPVSVVAPSIKPNAGTYYDEVEVSIVAAGDDHTIYYTVDGTEPTPGTGTTAVYTAPFKLTESATVKAVAEDAAANLSEVVEAAYVIKQSTVIPEGHTYTFLFNDEERNYTTTPADAQWSSNAEGENDKGNVTEVATQGITISMPEKAEGETTPSNHARLWKATNNYTLRFYTDQKLNISVPEGKHILAVVFYAPGASNLAIRHADAQEALAVEPGNKAVYLPGDNAESANFVATKTNQILSIDVVIDGEITGIDRVTVVNPAAVNNTFDLSGRRVSKAQNGLYIVNGQKVLVK